LSPKLGLAETVTSYLSHKTVFQEFAQQIIPHSLKNLSTFKMKLNLALLFSSAFALFGSIHAIVTDDIKDCDGHPGKTKERMMIPLPIQVVGFCVSR
jgi:hypothetical protein